MLLDSVNDESAGCMVKKRHGVQSGMDSLCRDP